VDNKSNILIVAIQCQKVSAQPGSQRCPVPAIRYSRGDIEQRLIFCKAALYKWRW